MLTKEKIHDCLSKAFPNSSIEIRDIGLCNFYAILTSDVFKGQSEAKRQEMIWGSLLGTELSEELNRLEFVFAETPNLKKTKDE